MKRLIAFWLAIASAAPAADLRLYPPAVTLTGPLASQRLLVVEQAGDAATADRTAAAKFNSTDERVARVDSEGIIRAAGNGTATIAVTLGDRKASVVVTVRATDQASTPDFVQDIVPVLTRAGCNSGACHGALAGKGGLKLSLRGYAPGADWFAITRQALGRRIDLARPDDSLLLQKATRGLPHGGGRRFESDTDEYRRIRAWIAAGAADGDPARPPMTALEVYPPRARLRPGDAHGLVAVARYADGRVEDVTPWARFNSSAESVATVDEFGAVRVAGPGEAAMTVGFGTMVATMTVTVPHDRPAVDFSASPRHNFIDDHVVRKLDELRLPASPLADDRTYIRRAFLDTLGLLPTPDEVERFVADAAPDKRARLAAALVSRPEYVDYWSYKWCDVLLLSTRKLPQAELWAFYNFVRAAVAENRPWDRFAREIVSYRGSTRAGGAGSYFVIHKDPAELTESTAVTFLGLSITCARCHNHPLERWTQDQYWAFANLFGRVGLKAGDRSGDVVITEEPFGDVPHQRTGRPQPPAPLDAAPLPAGADRRAAFADWLTKPDNPFFARAAVNRVWKNYFGRGLVEAEDDFRQSNPPTHPELLDELARRFVESGYNMRWLARTILESAAYQRSSLPVPGNEGDDRWLSRFVVRRLPAEVILDAYSQVTGVPTNFNQVYSANMVAVNSDQYPAGVRALQLPDSLVVSRFLDSFGRPAREQACSCERQHESSIAQALHLSNGKTLNDKLRSGKSVIDRWIADKRSDRDAVREAYRLMLCRPPTAEEESRVLRQLREYGDDRRAAYEDLFWAIGTGREFLFNH
jgi:hypothetical protein